MKNARLFFFKVTLSTLGLICNNYFNNIQSTTRPHCSLTVTTGYLFAYCHFDSSTTFAFRFSEVRLLLMKLDRNVGTDPLSMFPLFFKRAADFLGPCLSVAFWRLRRLGSFVACCSEADDTPIPKLPAFSTLANYPMIFMTPVLSNWAFVVGSSSMVYGTQRCASNHPVRL